MKTNNIQFKIEEGKTNNGQKCISLWKTHGKWENGDLFELSHPHYITAWYDQEPTQDEINRQIELSDYSRWNKELTEDQNVEVNEYIYMDQLEALPPHVWKGSYFEVGEPHHHDNKGRAIHRAFWIENGKYYTGYPKELK